MQHMLSKGCGTTGLAFQPGHCDILVQVSHTSALPCLVPLYSPAVAREWGVPALKQLSSVFTPCQKHLLPRGHAQGHLSHGKPSLESPTLTTWALLQLKEMVEPCMVRMVSTWGTLPATIWEGKRRM